MKLIKTIEGGNQELQIFTEVSKASQIEEKGYDDFKAHLYVCGIFTADVTELLNQTGMLQGLIDDTDWHEIFSENNS